MILRTFVEGTNPLDNENHFGSMLSIINGIVLLIVSIVVGVLFVMLGILVI